MAIIQKYSQIPMIQYKPFDFLHPNILGQNMLFRLNLVVQIQCPAMFDLPSHPEMK